MSQEALSILRNTVFTVSAQVVVRLVNVVALALLTNYLGPETYGRYTYAAYLGNLFSLLADFRLNVPLVRDVAQEHGRGERYLHHLLSLRLVLSGVCLGLLLLSLPWTAPTLEEKRLLVVAGIASTIAAFSTTYAGLFQALERMEFVALQTLLQGIISAAATLLTVWLQGPVMWVLLGPLAANILSTLVLAAYVRSWPGYHPWRWAWDWEFWKYLLKASLPIMGMAVLGQLHFRNDLVLLRQFHGERAVGIYGLPFRLVDALIMVEISFVSAAFPVVSRLYATSGESFQKALEKLAKLSFLAGLPLGIGVDVLAPHILPLFGAEFAEGTVALQWIIWVAILTLASALTHLFLTILNLQHWILLAFALALGVNLGLNFWLIPQWSWLGASIAKVSSEVVALGFTGWLLLHRLPPRGWGRWLVRLGLATLAMGSALWLARGWGWLSIGAGLAVYGVSLWLMKGVEPEEWAWLWRGRRS